MMAIRILPEVLQKTCELNLGEICTRRDDDIKTVQYWLDQQPHLKARTDVQWLLSFLRACEFSFEEVYHKLDLYYTARTLVPELFSNRNPFSPQIQELLNLGMFLPLKGVNGVTGERIMLIRQGLYDPQKITAENVFKLCLMFLDIWLNENDEFAINGFRIISDMKFLTFDHVKYMRLASVQKAAKSLDLCQPVKIKAIHYINNNSASTKIITMGQHFFCEYVTRRTYFYNSETIHELFALISKDILPVEYGGSAGSVDKLAVEAKKKMESYHAWFEDDVKYCTNEEKRFGGAKTIENVFGTVINFENLNID